jgi:ribosomal-protein-serine acetyltransferase
MEPYLIDVHALTRMALDRRAARWVDIRMDAAHRDSGRVAECCGLAIEGVLRRDSLRPDSSFRDTRVYARVRGVEEL